MVQMNRCVPVNPLILRVCSEWVVLLENWLLIELINFKTISNIGIFYKELVFTDKIYLI